MLLLCYVHEPARERAGDGRRTVAQQDRFSSFVKKCLVDNQSPLVPAPPAVSAKGDEWHKAHAHLHGQVVGAFLARPLYCSSLLSLLGNQERAVKDHWDQLKHASAPLLFFEVVDALILQEPKAVHAYAGHAGPPQTLAFPITPWSAERVLESACAGGSWTVGEMIRSWGVHPSGGPVVALQMPAAHAVLVAGKAWKRYALPFARARWLGWQHLRPLGAPSPLPQQPSACAGAVEPLSPELLQRAGDLLRTWAATNIDGGVAGAVPMEEIAFHVQWMQNMRDDMMRAMCLNTRRAFDLEVLLHSMMTVGFLKSSHRLVPTLTYALNILLREDAPLRDHLLRLAAKDRAAPTASTLYRHRLTLHMGYCRLLAAKHHSMLSEDGMVRWVSADSSPQGGWDWLMHGGRAMRAQDLIPALEDAHRLVQVSSDHGCTEEQRLLSRLADKLELVEFPPAAVGSGRANLGCKFHALAHSTRLMAESWSEASQLLSCIVTFTGDLGTEARFHTVKARLRDVFGEWIDDADGTEEFAWLPEAAVPSATPEDLPEDEFAFEGVSALPRQLGEGQRGQANPTGSDVDLTGSIYITGILHLVHNATQDFQHVWLEWPAWVQQVRQVSRMLKRRRSRDRLLSTCFSEPPFSYAADKLGSFSGGVYEGRWGSVLDACDQLLEVESVLRAAWSAHKYSGGSAKGAARAGPEDEHTINVSVIDGAISKPYFWAYTRMVAISGRSLKAIASWAEGCACHNHGAGIKARCPLRTMRAPELAAGALDDILQVTSADASCALLTHPTVQQLCEEERTRLMGELARAQRHIALYFAVKAAHWRQLPWVLFGLAHHDGAVARECGSRALALFATAPEPDTMHSISVSMCAPGSICHQQLIAFVQGESLWKLPTLARQVACFRFAPVTERWVESLHATTKRIFQGATHASPLHLAFRQAHGSLEAILQRSCTDGGSRCVGVYDLAKHCASVCNVQKALDATGMRRHPALEAAAAAGGRWSLRKKAVEIGYHVDRETLFGVDCIVTSQRAQPGAATSLPPGLDGLLLDALWRKHAIAFLRAQVLTHSDTQETVAPLVFSVPQLTASSLPRVLDVTNPTPRPRPLPRDDDDDNDDPENFKFQSHGFHLSGAPGNTERLGGSDSPSFFVVDRAHPASARVPGGAPKIGDVTAVAVSFLPAKCVSGVGWWVVLDGGGVAHGPSLLTSSLATAEQLSQMRAWKVEEEGLRYSFEVGPGASLDCTREAMQQTLRRLARCSPENPAILASDAVGAVAAAHELEGHGLAHRVGANSWALSVAGFETLSVWHELRDSRVALAPRQGLPMRDLAVVELLAIMQTDSWVPRVSVTRQRRPAPFRVGSEKLWWLKPGQERIDRLYLVALLTANEHGREVKHFAPAGYYQALVDGIDYEPQSSRRRAEFDFQAAQAQLDTDDGGPVRPPRQQPVRQQRQHRAAPAPDARSSSSRSRCRVGASPSTAPSSCCEGDCTGNDATSSSSSDAAEVDSDGSSSGSSNSSSSSATPSPDPVPGRAGEAAAAPAARPVAAEAEASHAAPAAAHSRALLDTTVKWKGFRLTGVFRGGQPVGYEVSCPLHKTGPGGARCCRSRAFSRHGGVDVTERLLKSWCVRGWHCSSTEEHKALDDLSPSELPTCAALDAMDPPAEPASGRSGSGPGGPAIAAAGRAHGPAPKRPRRGSDRQD